MIIFVFLLAHWFLSLFFQTFFLHRYASHKMFTLNPFWEKFFYILTFIFQGSSFLNPRAYAVLHRMHHAYSDTEKDPHSPHYFKNIFIMMYTTGGIFRQFLLRAKEPESQFKGNYPEWPLIDTIGSSTYSRLAFGVLYVIFYVIFATQWWMFLFLPIHFLMGPIQGAIVNWCGHMYGYSNFNNHDHSKNTTPIDVFMLGELFQNNHHMYPNSVNFAQRWFEIDPVYYVIKGLHGLGVLKLRKV